MKLYEILVTNRNLIQLLNDEAVNVSDIKHLDMFKEYIKMTEQGHKKTYIVQYLTDQYQVTERTVYRVIERFDKCIEL